MNPIQFTELFASIDEMAETTGFDLDFCQLEAGEPIVETKATILPATISSEFYFNKAFHQRGLAPDGYLSFGILQGKSLFRWMGKEIDSNFLFDFNARCGFEIKSEGPFSAKSIHVNIDRLYEAADTDNVDLSSLGKIDYALPNSIDPIKLHHLQDAIQNLEKLVSRLGHQPQGKADIETIEDAVYRNLAHCLDSSQQSNSISHSNRLAILRRSIDFIHTHHREVITITDICRACATTSRTLERVFREELGVAPKKYISLVKLWGARKDLCQNNQEKSIRDIAISWGFWHMGQFARDYKIHFGESPSQTR